MVVKKNQVFGHDRVSVLDGGLKKWRLEDRPLTATTEPIEKSSYDATFNSDPVIELSELLEDVTGPIYDQKYRIVDARDYRECVFPCPLLSFALFLLF